LLQQGARKRTPLSSGQSLNASEKTRRTLAVLLFLAIAATAWMMLHEAQHSVAGATHQDLIFNPGYQHAQRLKVAAARAAMDVLGMVGADKQDPAAIEQYQTDYRLQRMQIQADSEGLDRWAETDRRRQGLLLEIRASLVDFKTALDQATGAAADTSLGKVPLLPALNRAESAFSNYAASLTEPTQPDTTHYLLAGPVLLWWLLILLLAETAILTWLAVSARPGR
jgi:hypothetical protein